MNSQVNNSRGKILVVDDEYGLRTVIATELQLEGYIVKEVSDGAAAIVAMEDEIFDLAVIDLQMPYGNGFDVLSYIQDNSKELKTIVLTGYVDAKKVLEAKNLGADDVFLKPCDAGTLFGRISSLLLPA